MENIYGDSKYVSHICIFASAVTDFVVAIIHPSNIVTDKKELEKLMIEDFDDLAKKNKVLFLYQTQFIAI